MTGNIENIFGGAFVPPSIYEEPVEVQLADAMRAVGIDPPPQLIIDGQLHRFSTKSRAKDDSGWYVIFPDEPAAGRFGCWRDGIDATFKAKTGRDLTAAEHMAQTRRISEAKARRDQDRQRKAAAAADTVAKIWSDAGAASPDHPYLQRKGIGPYGARVTGDGRIMVPLYNIDGDLMSLQYIGEDGQKKYHPGGTAKNALWMLGDLDKTLFVAEGFATAATIHEVTGEAVAIAYSAHNIPNVVGLLRDRYGPTQSIVVVADNDASGTGRAHAEQAIAKHGGRVVMPPIFGDANDYHMAGHDLHGLLYPPITSWLIPADEFAKEPSPIRWLVKHWLQHNALMMVHGPSGGGKTFLVLDWCLRIASAAPDWMRCKVNPGRVVYLAGEGHHGLRGRIAAWKQHHGANGLDMWLSSSGCDLNTAEGYQRVLEAINALPAPPCLIVVDTLHRFLNGDENSAQDAKTMLDACGALMQEFSCSVLLVHHTGVSDEAQHRARGSSAWKGALDIEISVKPNGEHGPIEIIQRKAKDSEQAASKYGDLQSVEIDGWKDEDGEAVTSAVLVEGVEPVRAKASTPIAKMQKLFERAWFASGAEDISGAPYLTKSALEAFLEAESFKPSTIRNYVKPSYPNGLVGMLQTPGIIKPDSAGWVVMDQVFATGLMVQKGSKQVQ